MAVCLIISGGDLSNVPAGLEYDFVIACDRGYEYAVKLGIKPDLMIADFDSLDKGSVDLNDIPVEDHPVRKDDTDTMLAIKRAIDKGFDHIVIACALGGRLDHTIANIQGMAYAASHGVSCEIVSDKEHLRTFTGGTIVLPKKEGSSLSLFSLSAECTGITLTGSAYDCEDVTITDTFPLGVSNYWAEDSVTLKMTEGILIIVESSYS